MSHQPIVTTAFSDQRTAFSDQLSADSIRIWGVRALFFAIA
jgi:hypothetical protein